MHEKGSAHVFFLLRENVRRSLEINKIGHREEMEDIPLVGKDFLIADSRRRTVLGPFKVTSEQYYDEAGEKFHRRTGQGSDTILRECHYLFDFVPDPLLQYPSKGLLWKSASKLAGIPSEWWDNIRRNRLDKDQFTSLCEVLLTVNPYEVGEVEGLVAYDMGYNMTDDEWQDYVMSYYGDGCKWGEYGEPLNDAADRELRFGGDEEAWQSNGPGHGNE